MSKRDMNAPAVVGWLVAVVLFGFLHYVANRWLLDDADASVRGSLWAAALWCVLFGLLVRRSQRRATRREE